MSNVLIGSPVRQKHTILEEFLSGLEGLNKGDNHIEYYFVDDNVDALSTQLLHEFSKRNTVILKKGTDLFKDESDYENHNWKASTLKKITVYKNTIINYCIANNFDYLFLIDSDIVVDRRSLLQLLSDNVDIVSNVFWSQWVKNGPLTSQCFWIPDIYTQFKEFNVPISFEEANKIRNDKNEELKSPGLYKVNGLGACTLISRDSLKKGVNFSEIPNLQIPGEDRPFCIRAGALGYDLFMDTHYPAYHIHQEKYLDRVDEFKRDGFKFDMCMTIEKEPAKKQKLLNKGLITIGKSLRRIGNKLVRDFS